MSLPLPLIAGAAVLLVLSKKKKRKKVTGTGEPDDAPGSGWPEPEPGIGSPGSSGYITMRPGGAPPPIVGWNDTVESRALSVMTAEWEASDRVLSGGKFFILMRNTAMAIWPHVRWPTTINDEMKMVEVTPGNRIPRWVYDLGNEGPKALQVWLNLRTLSWNITGYKPPV